MENGYWPEGVPEIARRNQQKKHFRSRYLFINSFNGYRPGSMHLFLGIPGGGKSTMMRSLITDLMHFLDSSEKVLLWLSEETVHEFKTDLYRSAPDREKLKNLMIFSEKDIRKKMDITSYRKMIDYVRMSCVENDVKVLLFDNITTSGMYMGQTPSTQGRVALDLSELATDLNIPVVIFSHTNAGVTSGHRLLIDQNDIRGSKDIVNLAQYLCVMQRVEVAERKVSTIRIAKCRAGSPEHSLYQMVYNSDHKMYTKDERLDFSEFKKVFKERNVL